MAKKYEDVAQFFIVYIREAHPAKDWAMRVSSTIESINDPTTMLERRQVAETCVANLEIAIPTVVDNMQDSIAQDYKAHPDRLYVVGKDGRIAFRSGPGPMGFRPTELETALIRELEKIGTVVPATKRD